MKDNVVKVMNDFIVDSFGSYIDDIRGENTVSFTRERKTNPLHLMLQMFAQKGQTQHSELLNFYKDINQPLDISTVGFYKARMKFNPEAIRKMSNDFIALRYDNEDFELVKLNGYFITAIDGSDIILPSTNENAEIYGKDIGYSKDVNNAPVVGKLSITYDCINKLILDSQLGGFKSSEIEFAHRHLEVLSSNYHDKTITIFDRGYFSMKLICQMMDNNQKFLFRLSSMHLKYIQETLSIGDDKEIELSFDSKNTNQYRNDKAFRNKLLSSTLKIRMVKIQVEDTIEVLITNLSKNEFDANALKELYHLRWNIETSYNILKNRMKLEEFSGYKDTLIRQDIYSTIWLFNLIMLYVIDLNKDHYLPENRYKYEMKRNTNQIIGVIKTHFIKSLIEYDSPTRNENTNIYSYLIKTNLVPIRKGRKYKRGNTKNHSRMSYKYTY